MEEKESAGTQRHQRKRRFHFVRRKCTRAPHKLRRINFERRQNSGDHADQNRRQHNISPWILHLFREGRDRVEADIGEDRNRSAAKNSAETEGLRIVEGLPEKAAAVFVQSPNEADYESKKYHD